MYRVEMYARVRRACRVEGMSTREASRVFGLDRKTVRKMLSFSVPPGYRRGKPPRRPKLGPFTGTIDRILEDDRTSHRKQRHTAKRIFDRLRDEYGFSLCPQGLRSREECPKVGDGLSGGVFGCHGTDSFDEFGELI